jgi:hypothetical protein
MIRLYAPVAVAVIAILGLTFWEAQLSDRFTSSSMTAEEFGKRFRNVPNTLGNWVGQDNPVEQATLEQAGAVSHVNRRYVNSETGQQVDLWLIVGHAREICRHTPDICYPSQGYSQQGSRVVFPIETSDDEGEPAKFFTAKFRNESNLGSRMERVFWAWNGNREGQDQWEAPEFQKLHYGNNTALYKMYFTAPMSDSDEAVARNKAVEFAKLMLPHINRALFPERYQGQPAPAVEATASDVEATADVLQSGVGEADLPDAVADEAAPSTN